MSIARGESVRRSERFFQRLRNLNLGMAKQNIIGNGRDKFNFNDLARPKEPNRDGQVFIGLDDLLTKILPGSSLDPDFFLAELLTTKGDQLISTKMNHDPLGNYQYETGEKEEFDSSKIAFHQENGLKGGGRFEFNVFHGVFNDSAMTISGLAHKLSKSDSSDQEKQSLKADYQREVEKLIRPIFKKESEPDLYIPEDCLASADSLIGTLSYLLTRTKLARRERRVKVRIDVLTATAQGVLVLKKFAQDNHLDLELNVGYLAFGLSGGSPIDEETKVREHANYLVYPDDLSVEYLTKLANQSWYQEGGRQVVGDMGDAAIRLLNQEACPWENYRTDQHGFPIELQREAKDEEEIEFDSSKPTLIGLRNGGYLMLALWKYVQSLRGIEKEIPFQEFTFDAKRVWGYIEGGGEKEKYGVLLNHIPEKLLDK